MASLTPLIREIVGSDKTVEIHVTGTSMTPMLLHQKSTVRLAAPKQLHIGDLPLYQRENGQYILHRIISVENGCYVCCGDHQWHPEHGIKPEQVIAVVTDFRRTQRWCSCKNPVYRGYWHIWLWIRPLRHVVFGGLRRIRKLWKKEKSSHP